MILRSFRDAGCEAERLLKKYGIPIEVPAVLTSGIVDDLAERERLELDALKASPSPDQPGLRDLLEAYTSMQCPITGPGITRLNALLTAIVEGLLEYRPCRRQPQRLAGSPGAASGPGKGQTCPTP